MSLPPTSNSPTARMAHDWFASVVNGEVWKMSATARIALGLASLLSSLLLLCHQFHLLPNHRAEAESARRLLSEAIAVNFSLLAQRTDTDTMTQALSKIVQRSADLESIGIRREDGSLLIDAGGHAAKWLPNSKSQGAESQVMVPILAGQQPWGVVELRFRPLDSGWGRGKWVAPELMQVIFLSSTSMLIFYFYLRRVLRQLNPSKVVPNRVRSALDTLTEGLLVVDDHERVVLANRAFERSVGTRAEDLIGKSIHTIPLVSKDDGQDSERPWTAALRHGSLVSGKLFGIGGEGREALTFSVSAAPIVDEAGKRRGALASFEDVSRLEQKKHELRTMVEFLRASSDEIKRQNRELERLATRDPLTGCLNRRAFFDRFETEWKSSERYTHPLSALMVDIDHFKSINDNHGHAMGDEVLRQVAGALMNTARDTDVVARYGGEEFAIILPHTAMDEAKLVAERFRNAIGNLKFDRLAITASLGVSMRKDATRAPQDLLEEADKCLYVAKRNGRNQVVRFDEVPPDLVVDESKISRTKAPEGTAEAPSIPFHAVTALISALAYRDPSTAAHSRRVADLCITVAEGLMSLSDCYTLEIAALLHDIGKIGVPDLILLKPGPLTSDEWKTMRLNDKIGVEIIRASFANPALCEIVEHYQTHFGESGNGDRQGGGPIPLGARILAICDAYDAMVTDRVYRHGRTRTDAIAELRSCGGKQFDPELVERFVDTTRGAEREGTRRIDSKKEVALAIGQQLEHFCRSLDKHDFAALKAMTKRLGATAIKHDVPSIADKATALSESLDQEPDLISVLQNATELLDMCRATQSSFLNTLPVQAL